MSFARFSNSRAGARSVVTGLACVLASACSTPEPAATPSTAPQPAATAAPKPAAPTPAPQAPVKLTPSVSDPSFDLTLAGAGPYKAGELGRAVLTLTPKGIYHVNQDYPIQINVSAPAAVTLPKATFAKADAAEFADKSAKFDVPLTASAPGQYELVADVDFAVCTEETCVPDQRKLALTLPVE